MKNKAFLLPHASVVVGAVLFTGVTVVPAYAAEAPSIHSFRTTAPSMAPNAPMVFSWQVKDADTCSAYGGWSGIKGATGNEKVATPDASTTYGLQCSRGGRSAQAQFQVLVNPSYILFDFTQAQQYALVPKGGFVQLAWRGLPTSGICSMNASGMRLVTVGDGSQLVSPPSEGVYPYRLDCASPGMNINTPTITLVSYAPEKSRTVKIETVLGGNTAGKFQVASVRALTPSNPKDPYADRPTATNARIDMRGRATISGTYHYYPNTYGTVVERNRMCMTDLDGASEQQLPRLSERAESGSRFCFNNGDRASRLLDAEPGTTGTATIVIDGYTLIGDLAHTPDETYLLSVSAHRQTSPIKVSAVTKDQSVKNPDGKSVIIYLQPNQVIRIETVANTAPKIVKKSIKKAIAPAKKIQPKKKVSVRSAPRKPSASATLQPPAGKSTIKKVIPKASTQRTEVGAKPIAKAQAIRLYDAYIN